MGERPLNPGPRNPSTEKMGGAGGRLGGCMHWYPISYRMFKETMDARIRNYG